MEHLSGKPYYLTDEDILWVGTTLADMMPIECRDVEEIKRTSNEGYAAMMRCDKLEAEAIEYYRACIDAGALYAITPLHMHDKIENILRGQLDFTGIIINNEATLRDDFIQFLGLQAALGLHNK